jgi:hypothetical protein
LVSQASGGQQKLPIISKGLDEEQNNSFEVGGFGSKLLLVTILEWLVNSEMPLILEEGTNSSSTFLYVTFIGYHLVCILLSIRP